MSVPAIRTKVLVLDTAPLIKQVSLYNLSERVVTIPDVIAEVKDDKSIEALKRLPFQIEILHPSEESVVAVKEFAKKTGDYPSLSVTDIRVLALTWMLTKQYDGIDRIRTELPEPPKSAKKSKKKGALSDADFEASIQKKFGTISGVEDTEKPEEDVEGLEKNIEDLSLGRIPGFVETTSDGEDDGEGWINPENVEIAKEMTVNGSVTSGKSDISSVSCMTDDFAMQNVLLQMNLNLLSLDGIVVKSVKNWMLRCHACFKTTMNMDKRFCPSCGGNTLIRTSYSIENGILRLHLKKVFQYKTRGTVYSVPSPKGGRKGDDIILREDQKEFIRQQKSFNIQRKKLEKQEWDETLFSGTVLRPPTIGFGAKNPNQARRARK